jgi:hypothetical protein
MGAIGGCAVGHHMANEKAKQQAAPEGAQSGSTIQLSAAALSGLPRRP